MPILNQQNQTTSSNPNTIDYGKIIIESLKSVLTSSASQKLFLAILLFDLLIYGMMFVGTLGLIGLANNNPEQMTQKIIEVIVTNVSNPMNFIQMALSIFLLLLAIILVISLIKLYIVGWGISKILEELEGTQKNFVLLTWTKLIVLNIWRGIMVITSALDKKFFLIFIAIILLAIASILLMVMTTINPIFGIIASLIFILILILGLIYFFIIIYNSLRLSLAEFYLVDNSEKGVIESTKNTWEMTKGKVFSIIILITLLIIISFIINIPIALIDGIISIISITLNQEANLILQAIIGLIKIIIGSYLTVFDLNAMTRLYLAIKE